MGIFSANRRLRRSTEADQAVQRVNRTAQEEEEGTPPQIVYLQIMEPAKSLPPLFHEHERNGDDRISERSSSTKRSGMGEQRVFGGFPEDADNDSGVFLFEEEEQYILEHGLNEPFIDDDDFFFDTPHQQNEPYENYEELVEGRHRRSGNTRVHPYDLYTSPDPQDDSDSSFDPNDPFYIMLMDVDEFHGEEEDKHADLFSPTPKLPLGMVAVLPTHEPLDIPEEPKEERRQ